MNKKIVALLLTVAVIVGVFFVKMRPEENVLPSNDTQDVSEIYESVSLTENKTPEINESSDEVELQNVAEKTEETESLEVSENAENHHAPVETQGVDEKAVLAETVPEVLEKHDDVIDVPIFRETEEDTAKENSSNDEEDAQIENVCTLSISCANVFSNMEKLKDNKKSIIPKDGYILHETEVAFEEDETVFNVLRRTLKQKKIHLEFSATPIYNSMYIEGIGNLYEFDCGEMSGWTYFVNGKMPGYSCSEYTLSPGDSVEFVYTCDIADFFVET